VTRSFVKFGLAFIFLAALPFLPPLADRPDLMRWIVQAVILAQLALALDFSAGRAGIVNFGFAAFAGFGGYVSAWTTQHLCIPPWVAMGIAFVGSGMLGTIAGGLTLRLRGIYAAMGLWFLGLAMEGIAINLTAITGGTSGLIVPTLFQTASSTPYYYVGVALLVAAYAVFAAVAKSSVGLALRAIEQNLDAARASGVSVVRYRVLNFALSCAFAGLSGAFYAHYYGVLTPDVLNTMNTVQVLVPIYVGGRGTLWGGAVAAFPIVFLTNWLDAFFSDTPGVDLIVYSLLLMIVLVYLPRGFAEIVGTIYHALKRAIHRAPGGAQP
jgi:branched-chain amino acid transport system permease protein